MQSPGLLLAAETHVFPGEFFCLFENHNLCMRFLEARSLLLGKLFSFATCLSSDLIQVSQAFIPTATSTFSVLLHQTEQPDSSIHG